MTSTTEDHQVSPPTLPDAMPHGWLARTWHTHVTEVRRDTNAASLEAIGVGDRRASDLTTGTILVVAAACLIGVEYLGQSLRPQWFQHALRLVGLDAAADQVGASILGTPHGQFWGLTFWGAVRVFFPLVVPLVAARWLLGLRPADLGLRIKGMSRHFGPYLFLYVAAMPVIAWASFDNEFGARYPFYDPLPGEGLWPYVAGWWVVYALQFIGVEVFFRGFLVLGLAPRMGIMAVYVSVIPYVMIHFDKPMLETLGAIVAGIALGHLALEYRSIWWGAVLHIAIAISFDVLALWHEGFF